MTKNWVSVSILISIRYNYKSTIYLSNLLENENDFPFPIDILIFVSNFLLLILKIFLNSGFF